MGARPHAPRAARGLALAAFVAAAAAALGLVNSSADITIRNRPASGGRAITPAGSLVKDLTTGRPAVGALPVAFVRSPDRTGPGGGGRYLVAVNSGYGVQFDAKTNKAQQSLAVVDLNARPRPAVVQNVYFPTPQSANVGAVFSPRPGRDGRHTLYVSGGFENKVWAFDFLPGAAKPVLPASDGPDTSVTAPYIDLTGFATRPASKRYNWNREAVYPAGLALSPDGETLYVANNLGDSLGIVRGLGEGRRTFERIDLAGRQSQQGVAPPAQPAPAEGAGYLVYPYAVVALPRPRGRADDDARLPAGAASKVYVSCWNDSSVAVVDFARGDRRVSYVPTGRHPTAMILNAAASRLYVVNSDDDSVSVIDTATDREAERVGVRLAEDAPPGSSPEGLALSADGRTLYVANAHSNSVAVVLLSEAARGARVGRRVDGGRVDDEGDGAESRPRRRSVVRGFIPTGQYPSAVAVAGGTVFVGNGKGTGFLNSSLVADDSGLAPNAPNARFPVGVRRSSHSGDYGGQYSVSLVSGNLSAIAEPAERELARHTRDVMRDNGLVGAERRNLFGGRSPIRHVVYVIKENRTYDQLFGDLKTSGDGTRADGDPSLAIFGAGSAASTRKGEAQNVSPNHRALALRFGLFDRFFVNAEASPDGHNWSTAAFSTDFLDKAFRWGYSDRGRTYDYEGFNRMPNVWPLDGSPPAFAAGAGAEDVADFMRRYVPYLHGRTDAAEPATLYLWDAAARAGLTYRNYGEFVGTVSAADVESFRTNREKPYPDTTETVASFATKRSLEGHFSPAFRNFNLATPDAMTVESYRAARASGAAADALVTPSAADPRLRGYSRVAAWLAEFRRYVAARESGRGDTLPNFSIVRLPNDHTRGFTPGWPTAQFYVADNDYALGLVVEAVSSSPYWRDTAVFVVEDDAQDGPDHVDCHRSVALVISAYNRPGALVHEFHNTVSLIRTMELLLGIPPMNLLDATATPADIFRREADLRPYRALLPDVAPDNLVAPEEHDRASRYWAGRTAEQNLGHADMADAHVLNEAVWFSVRGGAAPMPEPARLPAFDAMRLGLRAEAEEDDEGEEADEGVARARRP
ncbi:MAG TPA: beta-propeller fold lactonase family protein [Pyrinomonadaceae bacterium]|jgi:YVTN family beta-propeller protein